MKAVGDGNVALFTDLYELTMAASYFANGLDRPATFDLSVRQLPEQRQFLVAAGLEDALDHLGELAFLPASIDHLATIGRFSDAFLGYLADLRFTGDVWAVPEGEVVFAGEPMLEVTAPLVQAQLVETFLLNCLATQTMIASKAARIAIACGERRFVDFSARRDHGVDAALKGARAAFIGGAAATSLVVAGQLYGLPLSGTMGHSYVMSFDDEEAAFSTYARDFPDDVVLLIDTYDTIEGAHHAAKVAAELLREGIRVRGVRLDSGDLGGLSVAVRRILDDAGLADVSLFASGDLDEARIAELIAGGAAFDAFGVGTQLGTSGDAPSLGAVYKLVDDERGPKMKLAPGKPTLPGRKQVHRFAGHDVVALRGEAVVGGRPLLEPVMAGGRRLAPPPPLAELQERCRSAVAGLPSELRALDWPREPYRVDLSPGLSALVDDLTPDAGGRP